MTVQLPKYVLLDTSSLVALAREWSGAQGESARSRALQFFRDLETQSWLLFFTGHHFHELLGIQTKRRCNVVYA